MGKLFFFFQMLPNAFFFFLIDCCGLWFFICFLLGHGALVKLFPLKYKWKISAIYLFWCIYCNYICNSFYLTDFYFLLKEAKGKINNFWDGRVFSGEIENTSSKLLRRQLWQRMSALVFVETSWNMEQCGDKKKLPVPLQGSWRGNLQPCKLCPSP